jgi:hypothetical protein
MTTRMSCSLSGVQVYRTATLGFCHVPANVIPWDPPHPTPTFSEQNEIDGSLVFILLSI